MLKFFKRHISIFKHWHATFSKEGGGVLKFQHLNVFSDNNNIPYTVGFSLGMFIEPINTLLKYNKIHPCQSYRYCERIIVKGVPNFVVFLSLVNCEIWRTMKRKFPIHMYNRVVKSTYWCLSTSQCAKNRINKICFGKDKKKLSRQFLMSCSINSKPTIL